VLEFLLEKIIGTKYFYSYFPEGNKNAPGMVAVDYDNGLREVVKESDDDFENLYAIHAMHGIGRGQTEGTVAWY
jgi:hypothetical protein